MLLKSKGEHYKLVIEEYSQNGIHNLPVSTLPNSNYSKILCMCVTYSPMLSTGSSCVFTPQPLRVVGVLFSPMVSGWAHGVRMGTWYIG